MFRTLSNPCSNAYKLRNGFSEENCEIMSGIKRGRFFPYWKFVFNMIFFFLSRSWRHCSRVTLDTFLFKINRVQESTSALELAVFIEPYKNVFQGFFRLWKIAEAIPLSTATCEKSFSWLKLIKTHPRATMSEWAEWFRCLAVMRVKSRKAKSEFADVQKHKITKTSPKPLVIGSYLWV